ncbi:MAG TPA: FUSC family protein [Gemmatimonadales bacterium]|nr:FUSC family protein [Gemmatimonadales bacterium]
MTRSTLWRGVFALKTFAAAMLALFVAFGTGMERPMWALTTVYVVSQPLSGAIRSKGTFRFVGTLIGAAVAVALTGLLAASPGVLTLALVGWFCLCGYLAAVDRTPRGYLYMLAGFTAVLAAMPGVSDPATVFQTAVARAQEIGLGVLAVVVVDALVFPSSVVPVLGAAVEAWLGSAERWMLDALANEPARRAASAAERRKLAADAARLDVLAVHLRFETAPELRSTAGVVAALRERTLLLLPTLSTIEDAARTLARDGAPLPAELAAFRDAFHAWVAAGSPPTEVPELERKLQASRGGAEAAGAWDRIVAAALWNALAALVALWSDCRALQRRLATGDAPLPAHLERAAATTRPALHRDHGLALWSAVSAALAFGVTAALWAVTQWPAGAGAALMALLMPMLVAGMDDPTPALAGTTKTMAAAAVFAGVYMYAVLPAVHSFPTLALALAVAFVPLGFLLADPAMAMPALLPIAQLSFDNGTVGDFASFANAQVATIIGLAIATVVIATVRAVGTDAGARRILRAGWAELAEIAAAPRDADRRRFTARMLDRLGLLVPRLATVEEGHEVASVDALTDLRTGLYLIALEEERSALPAAADRAVGEVLAGVAEHYARLRRRRRGIVPPPASLLGRVDAALATILAALGAGAGSNEAWEHPAVVALAGIRGGLFHGAAPFQPDPTSPLELAA